MEKHLKNSDEIIEVSQDDVRYLINFGERLHWDYNSEFEFTKKDKEVFRRTFFALMWNYKDCPYPRYLSKLSAMLVVTHGDIFSINDKAPSWDWVIGKLDQIITMWKGKMHAKITHMWDNWEYYFVGSIAECRDDVDRNAYETLWDIVCNKDPNEKTVQMGKILVERLPSHAM